MQPVEEDNIASDPRCRPGRWCFNQNSVLHLLSVITCSPIAGLGINSFKYFEYFLSFIETINLVYACFWVINIEYRITFQVFFYRF